VTLPRFNILTQEYVAIDLSRPAMVAVLRCMEEGRRVGVGGDDGLECELDNFCNMLQNLLERSEPAPDTENLDLIGD
jgi:hypothetical protein